jgi:hypothetical protein
MNGHILYDCIQNAQNRQIHRLGAARGWMQREWEMTANDTGVSGGRQQY